MRKRESRIVKTTTFMLCVFVIAFLNAQKVTVQVSSSKVQVGVPFQIAFSVNATPSTYTPPNFKDFDIYSGPNQSQSMQYINGNMSQSFSISFLISAKREGKITIGPMQMVVGGQTVQSNPLTVEAVKGNVAPQQQSGGSVTEEDPSFSTKVSGEDVFLRTSVSKTKCYLGEQVTVTQKVYSRLDLRGFQNVKFPSYNGFWSQQLENTNNIQLQIENVDGVNYYVGEFSRTYVFPQRTGQLTIDPTELECVVRKQSNKKPRNIFEQFFGSGGYEDVVVKVKSKPIVLNVLSLPEGNKPAGFLGGVGNFNYKVEASKQNLKANDAFNLKITISGKGNVKLIEPPKLTLPESFESYEPKITESITNAGGVSGTKTYNYLIIPREPGEFTISDLDFSYFDAEKKQYVSIPSPDIKIAVAPGDGKSDASAKVFDHLKHEVKESENDIRYIKSGNFELNKNETEFFNSATHIILMLTPLFVFIGAIGYRSYYHKRNSDIVAVKGRKAASVARKQLVNAEKQMKQNNKELFYTEVINAIHHYLGNKFNISVAELSKEKIGTELSTRGIKPDLQNKLFDTINVCEMAKYAPGAVSGELQKVYNNTVELISLIENDIKNA